MTPPRRQPEPDRVALPATIRSALDAVIRDMRNTPRDCIWDPAEMIHRQNRLARRLEGIRDARVALAPAAPKPPPALPAEPPLQSARDRAEAVFGGGKAPARAEARTVVSRKGRAVRVEVRRAWAAGQMELGL